MKRRCLALALAGCLALSGCSSMLERSYGSVTPHVDKPVTAEDSSAVRVKNYQELVSAVLYLVSQAQEEGVIQLYDYTGDPENDLAAACLEVAAEDPLGAYAVDYIKHEYTRVVSYYQATVSIHYRRTPEQIRSLVKVTGSRAIRAELQEALAAFAPEVVLRVAYFSQDEETIDRLIREAYYDTPQTAFGLPEAEISLYPDSGSQRVVEILLTYPEETALLREKAEILAGRVEELFPGTLAGTDLDREAIARMQVSTLWDRSSCGASYDPEGGSTAYDAIVEGVADSEGMALAYALLCGKQGVTCEVVEGTWKGQPRFWNAVFLGDGQTLYLDPSRLPELSAVLWRGDEMKGMGYDWPGAPA